MREERKFIAELEKSIKYGSEPMSNAVLGAFQKLLVESTNTYFQAYFEHDFGEINRLLQEQLSPDDPRMAPSLFSLSLTEYTARQLPEAEKLTTEAKRLWEKQLGPDSLEVSTCLNNLGRIHEETDRQEEGIAYHRAALNIRRKVLGDHPETAFSMGNLGTALAAAGKWQDAADTLQAAIDCYARCGHTSGGDIEGYRRNLDICRSALALEKP